MWDLQPAVLKAALSSRTVQTRNSTYTSPNNRIQAIGARDSLCSAVYTRVFDYLIHKTNLALQKYASQKAVVIGVLDIYGFEIFTV
jgi:myosin-1